MKKLIVNVTNEDIRTGRKECVSACPVAKAIRRAGIERPKVFGSILEYGRAYRQPGSMKKEATLPKIASRFVRAFDLGQQVRPFRFELKVA